MAPIRVAPIDVRFNFHFGLSKIPKVLSMEHLRLETGWVPLSGPASMR